MLPVGRGQQPDAVAGRVVGEPGRAGAERCALHQVALPMQLLVPLERVERLEHPEVGRRHHRGSRVYRREVPLSSRHPPEGASGVSDATEIGDATERAVLPRRSAPPPLSPEELRELLRWMIVARRLDRECIALQRQGELTVYPGFEGQEAAQVGSATALGAERLGLADVPRAGRRDRARRGRRPVPPVPPRHVARRPVRPARHPVRADQHPDRDPDPRTRSATRWGRSWTGPMP